MFGLSIGKLILLIGIIVVLWRGANMLRGLRDGIDRHNRLAEARRRYARPGQAVEETELFECPKCGTFVPNGTICPSEERCLLKRA